MKKKYTLIALLCLLLSAGFAQDINYGVWTQAGLKFELLKDLDASYSQMYRQDLQTPIRWSLISETDLSYKLAKKWSIGAEYRLRILPTELTNRVAVSVNFREGMGIFDLYYRSKLQHEWRKYSIPESSWRNRFKLRYDYFKDVKPYISFEIFLNRNYAEINFTTYRTELGVDWEVNKHNDLGFYIMTDQEIYQAYPVTDLIGGVTYKYSF